MTDDFVVVLGADERYALPLAVAVRSLLDNLASPGAVPVVVLDRGIEPETRDRLHASWPDGADVRFVPVDAERLGALPVPAAGAVNAYLNRAMYLRLLIPDLLPDTVARALYLDADTIVLGDVAALRHADLGGRPLGGVIDPYIEVVSHEMGVRDYREIGLAPDVPYHNSGVLLLDLGQWREQRLGDAVMAYLGSHPDLYLPDQDALNAVLGPRWTTLDPAWNVLVLDEYLRTPQIPHDEMVRDNVPPPGAQILHFAFTVKPWTTAFRNPGYLALYHRYQDRTKWAGTVL